MVGLHIHGRVSRDGLSKGATRGKHGKYFSTLPQITSMALQKEQIKCGVELLGFYRDNGEEHGNYYITIGYILGL